MLTDRLTELLSHTAGEVLKTPRLLMEMLSLYSKIFLNDTPCSTCEKMHIEYFARLQREGQKQMLKNKVMSETKSKYKFKIEGTLIHTPYGVYSQDTLTDSDVETICAEFPRFRNQFVNPPSEVVEVENVDAENAEVVNTPAPKPVVPKPVRKPRKK